MKLYDPKRQVDSMRTLVNVMKQIFPSVKFNAKSNRLTKADINRYFQNILGPQISGGPPHPQWGQSSVIYLSKLLSWYSGKKVLPIDVLSCFNCVGRRYKLNCQKLSKFGIYPVLVESSIQAQTQERTPKDMEMLPESMLHELGLLTPLSPEEEMLSDDLGLTPLTEEEVELLTESMQDESPLGEEDDLIASLLI